MTADMLAALLTTPGAQVLAEGASDGREMTAATVSPGLPGFIAMFLIAVATVALLVDMSRRIRRMQARDRAQQRLLAEEAADAEVAAADEAASGEVAASGEGPDAEAPRAEDPDAGPSEEPRSH